MKSRYAATICDSTIIKTRGPGLLTSTTRASYLGISARKYNNFVYIPAFSYSGHAWLGASRLLRRFIFNVSNPVSILTWPKFTTQTYLLVVGYGTTRYKMWKDVGEILYVPRYARQILETEFFIEVWSLSSSSTSVNASPIPIYISTLATPASVCDTAGAEDMLSRTECYDPQYDFTGLDFIDGDYFDVDACGNVTITDIAGATLNILTEDDQNILTEDDQIIRQ